MEYLIAGVVFIAMVLVFFLTKRKGHEHEVLIGRNESKTGFVVVSKSVHERSLKEDEAMGYASRYMRKDTIIESIESDKACFYTFSKSKQNYVKVRVSSRGFLTTEFDDVKDNNIESLKIME